MDKNDKEYISGILAILLFGEFLFILSGIALYFENGNIITIIIFSFILPSMVIILLIGYYGSNWLLDVIFD